MANETLITLGTLTAVGAAGLVAWMVPTWEQTMGAPSPHTNGSKNCTTCGPPLRSPATAPNPALGFASLVPSTMQPNQQFVTGPVVNPNADVNNNTTNFDVDLRGGSHQQPLDVPMYPMASTNVDFITDQTATPNSVVQAFNGVAADSIVNRQNTAESSLQNILPSSYRDASEFVQVPTVGVGLSGGALSASGPVVVDNAGDMMSKFAPKKDKLFASTQAIGCQRSAVLLSRSSRSRIIGAQSLLRPAPPIPNCGTQEPTFLDSELRHYALESNVPPMLVR